MNFGEQDLTIPKFDTQNKANNFIVDMADNLQNNGITYSVNNCLLNIKNKLSDNIIGIVIAIIFILAIVIIYRSQGNFNIIKFFNNNIVKTLIGLVIVLFIIFYWKDNKLFVILLVVMTCLFFYTLNDDIKGVEAFTIYNNQMRSEWYPDITNNPCNYSMVGCQHQHDNPCNECSGSEMTDIIDVQQDDFGKIIGADLEGDGNDLDLRMQKIKFGKKFGINNDKPYYPLNGRDFLKPVEDKRKIQTRKKSKQNIFDARDLTIETQNGLKKTNGKNNRMCKGPNCPKPEYMVI